MKIIFDIIIKKIFHRFSTTHHTQDGSLVVTEATCIIHTVRPVSQEKLTRHDLFFTDTILLFSD